MAKLSKHDLFRLLTRAWALHCFLWGAIQLSHLPNALMTLMHELDSPAPTAYRLEYDTVLLALEVLRTLLLIAGGFLLYRGAPWLRSFFGVQPDTGSGDDSGEPPTAFSASKSPVGSGRA